jgi:hypothetical protein
LNATGRVFLYSKNGNITVNCSEIGIDDILYAPKGNVTFNTYIATLNGCVWADTVSLNGSIFNISADNFDMVKPKAISKTYTTDSDFNEGIFTNTIPDSDSLTLSEVAEETINEKIYGDSTGGNGVKINYSETVSDNSEGISAVLNYGLTGFRNADINENAVDLIIVVDES